MKARGTAQGGALARAGAGLAAAMLLRSSFAARAGSARFYLLTVSLAGTWAGAEIGRASCRERV